MDKRQIYEALQGVVSPEHVQGLQIDENGVVLFSLIVDPADGTAMEDMRQQAEQAVLSISGVTSVTAILTAEKASAPAPNESADNRHADPHGMNKNPRLRLPIKKIIAVASGKGGVGKSTVAVNIAAALAKFGHSVGLLDADIYGPSVPRLTGLPYEKPQMDANKNLIPFDAHGMKVMSIGFMVDQETPMIWRGPMVQSAIYQMMRDVAWAEESDPLDILVIDMPPGTGDAQLTLAQKINVDGAIIVSTPQDLALIDAIKAIEMFRKTDVPILGLIENMSTHICTNCGHEDPIFGSGGAEEEAQKRGINFLGKIPLKGQIRADSDNGKLSDIEAYSDIANLISSSLRTK
jgi:ATP-binding protein involved in chromosome partitioning